MQRPLIIGVAGGSGSGKTTVSHTIVERVGTQRIALLQHDNYYSDLAHLPFEERTKVNFDHPNAFDNSLFLEHIDTLASGQTIQVPTYDFANYVRLDKTIAVEPRQVILIEGILIFAEPALQERMDIKLFVDTASDMRFIRRLQRDINERGRSVDSVIEQYLKTVRPMHIEFVEPSRRCADIIIPRGGLNQVAIDMIVARIERLLQERRHEQA